MLIMRNYGGKKMLKIAVCDDDKDSLAQLCQLLEEYRASHLPELRYTPFTSSFGLLSAMECGHHFDVAILDILMPNTNGMETAAQIRRQDESMEIVFCSTSSEFALESYSVRARNYILKPVDRQKFFSVMDQVVLAITPGSRRSFWVKDKAGGISRIIPSRLVYCEVIRKEIVFHMADAHTITCKKSLVELIADLGDDEVFFQPHRSYLVNMDHVQRVTKTELVLTGGVTIPLSRGKSAQAMEAFINHSFHALLSEEVLVNDAF